VIYFLFIKPAITLSIFIVILIVVPVSFILVFPAPAVLRMVKQVGRWQAGIAIEGVYMRMRL
jgi:hypothetical protein